MNKPYQRPLLVNIGGTHFGVRVAWNGALGSSESWLWRLLRENLENIDGVEEVKMLRYSAWLDVALHVTSVTLVRMHVRGLFADPIVREQVLQRGYSSVVVEEIAI